MYPLIIDHRPPYLGSASAEESLLTLPVGGRSFVHSLAACVAAAGGWNDGELLILPTFPHGEGYEQRVRSGTSWTIRVIDRGELETVVNRCEPADTLLLIDPAQWPAGALDPAAIAGGNGDYRGATHMIAVGADAERTQECVERDGSGHVRRVQRLYNGVTWPEVAASRILFSVVPAWTIRGTSFRCLADLRSALAAKGVLSRDVPLAVDVVDLTRAEGMLALNERRLVDDLRRPPRSGFVVRGAGVAVGRGCRIDGSARLVGPVILHDGVTIEAGVTIVGPSVLGARSRVRRDAVIAQSLLACDTVVESGATVRHRVTCGSCSGLAAGAASPPPCMPMTITPLNGRRGTGSRGATRTPAVRRGRRFHLALQRVMDVTFSLAALVALSPLLIAVAILIKLESRGPVLFIHRREQKGGKEFPCLKFRTMTVGAHRQQRELYKQSDVDGPQFKVRNDPRVTRVGDWLRGTNIDELPQLINVLLGHMSVVGPRPSPFRENQICVPWRRARLSVRPGITGLWQLCRSGDPSAGGFHEWIFYDLAYVRHFSIWLDLKILLATVLTMGGRWSVPMSRLVRDGNGSRHSQEMLVA